MLKEEIPESSITKEEEAELNRRLDAYHQDPNKGAPWSIVREQIKNQGKHSPFTLSKPVNS